MAEDLENTQKPKVTLIKQQKKVEPSEPPQPVAPEPQVDSEHSEKKKVVVIKKKVIAKHPQPHVVSRPEETAPRETPAEQSPAIAAQPGPSHVAPTAAAPAAQTASPAGPSVQHAAPAAQAAKPPVAAAVPGPTGQAPAAPVPPAPRPAAPVPPQRPPLPGARAYSGPPKPGYGSGASSGPGTSRPYDSNAQRPSGPPRPADGSGYSRPGYQGSSSGYQGSRPAYGQGSGGTGYQGSRPYQGSGGTGYQGSRPGYGQSSGGTGYQGSRPGYGQGGGTGYQGSRPGYGQGGGTGYQGSRPAGGPGYRPGGPGRPGMPPRGPGYRPGGPGGPKPDSIMGDKKAVNKKFFKAKKPQYVKRDRDEIEQERKLQLAKRKAAQLKANPIPKEIDIMESVSVSELARKMNLKASDLIAKLFTMGMMVTMNQSIDAETATLLASEYGCEVHIVSLYDETVIEKQVGGEEDIRSRPPIVTVMGHVDHGKTKLLDAIRKTNVVATEFGGITQHIGAYMVETPKGKITFLDTPGHEAFTMMRARGAQITDIVILVVAANDGVMPQTIEALNHAKEAKVPIIVAINKIDLPEANPDRVKTQLSELGLIPEDWGGQTMFCPISALKKEGIAELLDSILLQAEILELKSNYASLAEGKVLEARIDQGRGIVSTVIVQRGTIKVGDPFVAGIFSGRVRALFNDRGEKIDEATPAMPVEVLGIEGIPNSGDPFQAVDNEKYARQIGGKRQELQRFEDSKTVKKITLDNLYQTITDGEMLELKVIIKGDVQGTVEAVKSSLEKLSTKDIRLNVITAAAGAINESDVDLASASNAIIVAFNVRPTTKAKALADQEKVDIRKYNVIYKAIEEIQAAMEGMLKPDLKEQTIGTVEVRNTFKVPKIGTVAGCMVIQGKIKRNGSVNVIRDGIVIYTGKIASLKRFKDDAREVETGFECGVGIEGYNDVRVGDQFEAFETIEVAKKLGETLIEQAAAAAVIAAHAATQGAAQNVGTAK
jgi:translation initiation factor IF-2